MEEGETLLLDIYSAKKKGVWFSVVVNRGKIVACAFSDRSRTECEKAVRSWLPNKIGRQLKRRRAGEREIRILADFYDGKGKRVNIRNLDLSSASNFRQEVYALLCRIPRGKVTTYGEIARRLGGRRYARAVGTAVAKNPLPPIVPCHRVVPSSLKVGNYGMCGRNPATGGYMKRMLLRREGVKFHGERVSKQSLWTPN